MSEKFTKCNKDSMCPILAARAELPNARKKGFVPIFVVNLQTGEPRFLGVAHKMGAKDNGIMLNVCPFCKETPGEIK